jgi:hypothetical protein
LLLERHDVVLKKAVEKMARQNGGLTGLSRQKSREAIEAQHLKPS